MQLFSLTEVRDLIISVLAITLIISYPNFGNFVVWLAIVLLSFVLHELAHKFVAIKFGAVAFYKMWTQGLLIGLLTMLIPFRFVAPGAVQIYQHKFGKWKRKQFGFGHVRAGALTQDEMGLISVSGPLVNLVIAGVAALLPGSFALQLARLNSILAFFNIIPMKPLDGSKILEWKPWVWVFLQIVSIVLVVTTGNFLRF